MHRDIINDKAELGKTGKFSEANFMNIRHYGSRTYIRNDCICLVNYINYPINQMLLTA